MAEKIERQLPTGIGGEKLKENRETLPAVEVANEVSWVNNKMNLPFDLRVGESSRLGMFLTPNPQTGEQAFNLEVSGSHTRSGILGRVIFSDKEGRLYRDIDLKGTGYIHKKTRKVRPAGDWDQMSKFSSYHGTSGIADQELIRRDVDFSEKFLKAGILTHRVVALFDLKQIIDQSGQKISIAEAKERGILSEKDEPVIEMRAYGVRTRLWDIYDALGFESSFFGVNKMERPTSDQAIKLLTDAKMFVAQERNINPPDDLTFNDYFRWLVETIAINIARMHYNNWVSGYLTPHNMTLDGRFVDLDSVEVWKGKGSTKKGPHGEKNFENDVNTAIIYLEGFFGILRGDMLNDGFTFSDQSFKEIYRTELSRLKTEKVPRVRN